MDKDGVQRLIGTTLEGRFRIEALAGQGGSGFVFQAHHEELDIPVAIKVLTDAAAAVDNAYAHARQEARLLARLHHPNIVRALDYFMGRTIEGLVLEYVEGHSLSKLAHGSPMPWQRACRLASQCCEAVQALHEFGFAHRDLKPANFMVQRPRGEDVEVVKLIDLGAAKHLEGFAPLYDNLDRTTTLMPGTLPYMPPEQARGELRRATVRTDTYGLVVTLYFCLTGRPPFRSTDTKTLIEQVASEAPEIPDNVHMPAGLRELLLRGLDKDPARRFATPAELAGELRAILMPAPARVTRTDLEVLGRAPVRAAAELAATPTRSRRVGSMVASVAVLAGLLALVQLVEAPAALRLTEVGAREAPVFPAAIVQPGRAAPAPSVGVPAIVAAPDGAAQARVVSPEDQVRRLVPRLRRCPSAPRGPVLVSVADGLRQIDLVDVDRRDEWQRCAAELLAGVTGEARVDLRL